MNTLQEYVQTLWKNPLIRRPIKTVIGLAALKLFSIGLFALGGENKTIRLEKKIAIEDSMQAYSNRNIHLSVEVNPSYGGHLTLVDTYKNAIVYEFRCKSDYTFIDTSISPEKISIWTKDAKNNKISEYQSLSKLRDLYYNLMGPIPMSPKSEKTPL